MNTMIPMLALTLTGNWQFGLDPDDRGIDEPWFQHSLPKTTDDPVSRQMHASLLRYMTSLKFNPSVTIRPEQIASLVDVDVIEKETP